MPTAKRKPASPASKIGPRAVSTPRAKSRGAAAAEPPKPRWSEQYEEAVGEYAKAVEHVQKRSWADARPLLEAIVEKYGKLSDLLDITDRARTYLRVCERNLGRSETDGDSFLLGVFHGNQGDFDEAIRLFEQALESNPRSDKVLYAMAAVRSQKKDRPGAVESLKKAIEINDTNRVYALNDPDFDPIRDEPEFIDLVEPEDTSGGSIP